MLNGLRRLFSRKSYRERYNKTNALPTDEIKALTAERRAQDKPTGVADRILADRSDARCKALNIDPPREGRKTYQTRYDETSALSNSELDARIAAREANGQETGVLRRVRSERS